MPSVPVHLGLPTMDGDRRRQIAEYLGAPLRCRISSVVLSVDGFRVAIFVCFFPHRMGVY